MKISKGGLLILLVIVIVLSVYFVTTMLDDSAKKVDPEAYKIVEKTFSNSTVPADSDTIYYWRIEGDPGIHPKLYRFNDEGTGKLYDFNKEWVKFDYKRIGDLVLINYKNITEHWIQFNKNTLVNSLSGSKLVRVQLRNTK